MYVLSAVSVTFMKVLSSSLMVVSLRYQKTSGWGHPA
jgi:hypothetical protein